MKLLYTGLKPKQLIDGFAEIDHLPVLKIKPKAFEEVSDFIKQITLASHIIITSQTTAEILANYLQKLKINLSELHGKIWIAVGKSTEKVMKQLQLPVTKVAEFECAEGVIEVIKKLNCKNSFFFWPHSSLARSVITNYLKEKHISYVDFTLYEPIVNRDLPLPCLENYDAIMFTSPSGVDAFKELYGYLPKKQLLVIGHVTKSHLATVEAEPVVAHLPAQLQLRLQVDHNH